MLDKLLRKLGVPYFDIEGDDGTLYLRRFYIYRGQRRPHIYLHHIIRSDYDRACHDHPWDFTSIILWGGYLEHLHFLEEWNQERLIYQPEVKYKLRRRPLTIVKHKATDLHRLELDKPAWTLVFTGPRLREWGFQTEGGWVVWHKLKQAIQDMMS